MPQNKRKTELSFMNIVLCLLVIFIHTCSNAVNRADPASWQYALLIPAWRWASFAVQGFLFLGGIRFSFSAGRENFSYPRYYLSRLRRVVLPYLIGNLIYVAYFLWRNFYTFTPAGFLHNLLNGDLTSHFYFIVIILQFYLLAPLWRGLLRKRSPVLWGILLILCMILSRLPVSGNWCLPYLYYWVMGLAAGLFYEQVRDALQKGFLPITLLFAVAAAAQGVFSWLHFSGRQTVYFLGTVHELYVAAAILFVFALALRLSKKPLSRPLALIDRASFSIYLWHVLVLYEADRLLYLLGVSDLGLHLIGRGTFTFGVTLLLCCTFAWLAQKCKRSRSV